MTVSQYAEARRVLPPGTPFPGPWSNSRTPYLTEPMDNMSPSSPVQRTVIAKGAQLGFTAAAENVAAFWMDANPAEILFVSATEELLRKWVTKRLEPTIDSCGFRRKIAAQGQVQQKRRTGDRVFTKEFPGGTLDMASAQAAAALRADSKRILIRDEIDGAPASLRSGEGSWLDVSYVRTNAWGSRRKVLDFSTPTTFEDSAVWPEYLAGDCRKFSVPCPHCGGFQFLVWDGGTNGAGIKWRVETAESAAEKSAAGNGTTAGHVAEVWYQCEHCGGAIKNHDKATMLPAGEWQPTAISESPTLRSYHLSSLYSPVGMLSWEELVAAYIKAQNTPDGLRSFTNLYLGEPFRETGQRPNVDRVINLRMNYKSGTIPSDDVLFLTMSIDVQRGSEKNPENPARLEVEVCGHGAGYRTWSISYFKVPGAITNPYSGAWEALNQMALAGSLKYLRGDGRVFVPVLTLVDSGDGMNVDCTYQWAAGWRNCYPAAGSDILKKKLDANVDEPTKFNLDRYRVTRQRGDSTLVQFSSSYYKSIIYRSLAIPYHATGEQAPGFCAFPSDYSSDYFLQLTAEEHRRDGSFYCPSGRRNEALDLRVMNLTARDLFLDLKIEELRTQYQARGATKAQLLEIRSPAVLNMLAAAVKPSVLKKVV
jgi:phage terminase large subunit GpA-like protein